MNLKSTEKIPNHTLVKENSLISLSIAHDDLKDSKISSLEAMAIVIAAWDEINDNPKLKISLDKKMEKEHELLEKLFGERDTSTMGNPVKKKYNPNHWMGDLGENKKAQEGKLLDKMNALQVFFKDL